MSSPLFVHLDAKRQIKLEIDVLSYAISGILFQKQDSE